MELARHSEYRLRRRVQFHEVDSVGIVHFSCYFRYMEEAEHALWREAGLSIAPKERGIGFPRVATSFDFAQPLRFEDECDILIRIVGEARPRHGDGEHHPRLKLKLTGVGIARLAPAARPD